MKLRITAIFTMTIIFGRTFTARCAELPVTPRKDANGTKSTKPLPKVFASVLPQIKAKARIPILLPTEFNGPKYAIIESARAQEYAISLFYGTDTSDADLAAFLSADANPGYSPADLGNVRVVKLAHGIRGFFRPVSCGGSCAPANLWWEQGGVLYQIQIVLGSTSPEDYQEGTLIGVADSAILAGPR